ncbi:MAG TPA: hypothetical protein D7I05_04150, partial [Candidatus Poseidoniales archaeon]
MACGGHADRLFSALLVDIPSRRRAPASRHMDLIMKALKEFLGGHRAAAGANDAGASGRFGGNAEA